MHLSALDDHIRFDAIRLNAVFFVTKFLNEVTIFARNHVDSDREQTIALEQKTQPNIDISLCAPNAHKYLYFVRGYFTQHSAKRMCVCVCL